MVAACVCFGCLKLVAAGNALIALAVVFVGGAIDNELHTYAERVRRGGVAGSARAVVPRRVGRRHSAFYLFDDPTLLWLPFVRVVFTQAPGCWSAV